jgi:cellulose synthase/poly-beta-1,6-N-acetylglucosamine synthase-like glycosyltransferase
MGLALAADDQAPVFCPAALVTSDFPVDPAAQESQRTRWEHGLLAMIGQALPSLIKQYLKRPRIHLLALALDLSVPTFTLLMLTQIALFAVCAAAFWATGAIAALCVVGMSLATLCAALMLAWFRFGRDIVGLSDILTGFGYVAAKLPMYVKFVVARQTEWIRTKRDQK